MKRFILLLAAFFVCSTCFAGTWGPGSFDNDDALDWLDLCIISKGTAMVESALRVATSADALDAVDGARAVAAAEIVAAAKGKPSKALTKEVGKWLSRQSKQDFAKLDLLAKKALAKLKDPEHSELRQLWNDVNDEQWTNEIADLEARLQ